MGERRHVSAPKPAPKDEPQPEAPEVETTQDLGALETACTIFDNEIDRLMRVVGAREAFRPVTAQVRELLGVVQPLQHRKDALEKEIAQRQDEIRQWEASTKTAAEAHQAYVQGLGEEADQVRSLLEKTKSEVAHERMALREEVAQAREGHQSELRTLMEVAEERKQDLVRVQDGAEVAHRERLTAMQDELDRMQEQIEEAKRLRDQLTAIRG